MSKTAASEEAREIAEMTAKETMRDLTIEDAHEGTGIVAEIPKSPCMSRPKKDKQPMVLVHMSPRNLLRTKLTMEEKGKVINLEVDEEEEDFEGILVEEEEDIEMEVETQLVDPLTKLPMYVPPWKGKARVPKDIDESKSFLQTSLLLDGIFFLWIALGASVGIRILKLGSHRPREVPTFGNHAACAREKTHR